jgi:16S rRNA (uracil1498-N3)-methyltransferase
MQRYFVSHEGAPLSDQDQKHIIKVLRMRSNERIIVCSTVCFEAIITIQDGSVTYKEHHIIPKIKKRNIILVQGMPKHPKIETTIKYASMVGVSKIILVPMAYSIVQTIPSTQKLQRYDMIAKEACELAHRDDLPEIKAIPRLEDIDLLKTTYVLDEKTAHLPSDNKLDDIMLIVGPEGGIHPDERMMLLNKGAIQMTLGPLIMSSEIAGVIALSKLIHFDI